MKNKSIYYSWNLPELKEDSIWSCATQIESRCIYDSDAYMIYHICHILCGYMCAYQKRRKCGYGRMVKFLLAKEKMRVRFPLSARGEVMYYDNQFGIVDYDSIVVLSSRFFASHPKTKKVSND